MLNQQTIEKLYAMRMRGMAEAFTQQQEDSQTTPLSFEERFALLVDRQWNWRQNRALERRIRDARLQGPACMEDIDFRAARGLDKQVIRSLIHDSDWVRRHQHAVKARLHRGRQSLRASLPLLKLYEDLV
jgi:hypothetical protein